MSTLMKALLALAVALPLGAYVTGTLVASGEEPRPRQPVIIEENTATPPDRPTPRDEPSRTPDNSDDDDGTEGRGDDDDDDDEIDVITPRPGDVDDDDDRGAVGGDDTDDDSEHGGGDDGDD